MTTSYLQYRFDGKSVEEAVKDSCGDDLRRCEETSLFRRMLIHPKTWTVPEIDGFKKVNDTRQLPIFLMSNSVACEYDSCSLQSIGKIVLHHFANPPNESYSLEHPDSASENARIAFERGLSFLYKTSEGFRLEFAEV